jgi:hypothetical protein
MITLQNVNAFLGLPVGAAAGSLYFSLTQIDGHEGAATVAASCQRCGFFTAARASRLQGFRPFHLHARAEIH